MLAARLQATGAVVAALSLGLAAGATAQNVVPAVSEREIVELAGQGRHDELAQRLAAREAQLRPGELHALCFAWARTKRYRPLMTCLDRLELALRGRDRASILFGLDDATATVNLMRAEALLDLGQPQAAGEQAERALAWFEREGSAGERDIQVEALALLALAAARQQEPAKANEQLRKIEAIKPGITAGPNLANARTLGLARGHLALGQFGPACAALEADRNFEFRRTVEELLHGNPPNWVWQQLPRVYMLARCRLGLGKQAEAKAGYDELLRLPALRQNGAIHWMVLHDRARIAEAEGDAEAAISLLRQAIEIIEQLRSSIDTEAAKIGFVADKQAVYGALVGLLLASNRAGEALEVVERAKARALVDLLADRYSAPANSPLMARGDARLAALLDRHREAEETLQAQPAARSESTLAQQRNGVASATAQLRQAAPELASLVSVAPATAAELVRLLDADEVGLQYYLYGERLFALVFGAQGSRAFTLDGAGLIADIRDFRAAIVRRAPQTLVLAQKLYARLVAPLESALGQRAVLLVPHSGLHYLPFGALHDGQRFMLEKHALRVTTSVSALKFLHHTPAKPGATALILGNPTSDLPSAEAEARQLSSLLPGSSLLLGTAATRQALFAAAPGARTIHIASHAVFDARQPLESRLMLAPPSATAASPESGALRVGDIYGLNLTADLVTLSACETGLGRITDGGEVIGMARGFLYAGSATVVASLWQVADEATATLMGRFYANLPRMNKRDALRAAQLELARRSAQPYFWASFYLNGSSN
jgi:CHAT domain-containing protein/tetratricopeptide (TPR) repeat protein